MNHARTGTLLHEKDSLRVLWANDRACELFKYSVAELRSLKSHHMSSQDERYRREGAVAWLHSAALYGSSRKQWKYQDADGNDFLTDAVATIVPLHDREVIMVELRRIDDAEAPPDSPEWISTSLERIISHTAAGVLVLDTDNHVDRASPYAARLFGMTSSSIIGKALVDLVAVNPALSKDEFQESITHLDGSVNFRVKVGVETDPLRWLACDLEDVRFEGSSYRVLTVRDITDRVEAEKHSAAQDTQLQYLSRYNAMGDMAMVLAHDLGQPLAASLNYLSGLKSRLSAPGIDPKVIHYGIGMVKKQLERASEIVASAKRYVRRSESTKSTFNLPDTVEESLYFVRLRAAEEQVDVHVDLGTQPLILEGESVLIGQVIINLCMNAIDEISCPETIVNELDIKLSEFGGVASLTISDQGRGMQTVPANRLAAGAFSSKEDGSGIGLIISEHIAQRHGGSIVFAPNHPQGTVATLSLPLQASKTANASNDEIDPGESRTDRAQPAND